MIQKVIRMMKNQINNHSTPFTRKQLKVKKINEKYLTSIQMKERKWMHIKI